MPAAGMVGSPFGIRTWMAVSPIPAGAVVVRKKVSPRGPTWNTDPVGTAETRGLPENSIVAGYPYRGGPVKAPILTPDTVTAAGPKDDGAPTAYVWEKDNIPALSKLSANWIGTASSIWKPAQ
jgi:hypothetical protein